MQFEYFSIVIFLIVSFGITIFIPVLSYVLGAQRPYSDKITAYECGFNAFDESRMQFDVRFYLVGILFIIFDLEISYLFPWAMQLSSISLFGWWTMMIFLFVLTVGFVYEWKKGALEWE